MAKTAKAKPTTKPKPIRDDAAYDKDGFARQIGDEHYPPVILPLLTKEEQDRITLGISVQPKPKE